MAYALLDNATLTAVQRLTGQAQSRSEDSTDGDIVALENLLQAILLYDDLITIDNYKEEYRETRKKQFDFIRFVNPAELRLNEIEASARNEALSTIPTIRGGQFVDADFRSFLELLKVHMICTWDVRSSVYYLTMKMLGQPNSPEFGKYSNISASIFSELVDAGESDARLKRRLAILDRNGKSIDPSNYVIPGAKSGDGKSGGVTDALEAFVAALGWLSYKTLYYVHSARFLHADTFLYPVRQAFQIHYMQKKGVYSHDFTKSVISRMTGALNTDLHRIVSSDRAIAAPLDLPVFSAWLVMQCGSVTGVVEAARQLRNDKRVVVAREQIREIRSCFDSNDLAGANKKVSKILTELEKTSAQLVSTFGLKSNAGVPMSRLMMVYNTVAAFVGWPKLPQYDFQVKLPKVIADHLPKQGFSALYRDIGTDLAQAWRLGEARQRLGAAVEIDRDRGAYNPKTEAPEYRNAHSWWKSPM
jgi:hypothetical protein